MNRISNISIISPFFRNNWLRFILGIAVLIIVDILQLFIPRLIGLTVDALLSNSAKIEAYLYWLIALSLIIAILRYVYRECIMGFTRRLESWLREVIFAHAIRLPMTFYDEHGPGKVMAYTTNDISAVRVAIGFGTMLFTDAIIMGFASMFVMAKLIDWNLTFWTVLPLPIILSIATWMGKSVHVRFRQVQEKFSCLTEFTQEIFSGAKILKGFGVESHTIQRFSVVNEENVAANMAMARLQAAYMPVTHIAPLICYAVALYIGGTMIMAGIITVGDFASFTGYLGLIIWPVMGLGYLINTIQRGSASLGRISEFLNQLPHETDQRSEHIFNEPPSISIQNLTFYYPGATTPSLKSVSCFIPAGSVVGIVGGTGAGKSTLLKLLLRLYEPSLNTIVINYQEIHTFDFNSLRQAIGYVPQDSFLFSRTIGENIAFSDVWPRWKIEEAAQMATVSEAIDEKPLGFQTILGEKGKRLSGGQQQRVAIARALIKDPPLLLLDDVFAALDYRTQKELLENLRNFLRMRTTLIVSQRVAAVKEADFILVMHQGELVEQGTHQTLVAKHGIYYRLYEQQFVNGEE